LFRGGRRARAPPPHEHTMAATIAVLEGLETNVFYELVDGTDVIREVGRRTVAAGEVLTLGPTAVHSVQYPTASPIIGLHVYRGDLVGARRRMWSHQGDAARPYDQSTYDTLRRALPPGI
jgi:predicted metal-dependent enzyme (double-stranded beta helix superfamily)